MKRTTKAERKENAKKFWNSFQYRSTQGAIVVRRNESTSNPYVARTQFLAVCSLVKDEPLVIAESLTHGIEGCFIELLQNIKDIPQTTYFEDGFKDFIKREYGFTMTYNDGLVIMLNK